jgi:hypothetical protein
MDALALLSVLAGRGMEFMADGNRLRFRPVSVLGPEERLQLRNLKGEIILLLEAMDPSLEALCSTLKPEDAQDLREERAAILEHEAGMSREEAERRAGIVPSWAAT